MSPRCPRGLAYVEVDAGWKYSVARLSDGSVAQWGAAVGSVPALPPGLTYVEVAAGREHTVARRSDGSAIAWGDNTYGQCSVPALTAGLTYTGVEAGGSRSVARVGPACSAPTTTYCTAKVNSLGCTPSIAMPSAPSASAGSGCTLTTNHVIAKKNGLYFHGTLGEQALPFHGGYVCVMLPKRHQSMLNSGGSSGTCNGVFSEDFNAYIAGGFDPALVAGAQVWIQNWSRDPGDVYGDSLSDAVSAAICP